MPGAVQVIGSGGGSLSEAGTELEKTRPAPPQHWNLSLGPGGREVPELDGSVESASGEGQAVGRERERVHAAMLEAVRANFRRMHIPGCDGPAQVSGGLSRTIRADRHCDNGPSGTMKRGELFAAGQIANANHARDPVPKRQIPGVGRNCECSNCLGRTGNCTAGSTISATPFRPIVGWTEHLLMEGSKFLLGFGTRQLAVVYSGFDSSIDRSVFDLWLRYVMGTIGFPTARVSGLPQCAHHQLGLINYPIVAGDFL